ncbi:MAG: hypothetical protein EOO09_06280 [Chitinophagaceae bacterium]|nr:MAG: hypothetical protein EOO09_06280 [Chitinophagaceae bacterium]
MKIAISIFCFFYSAVSFAQLNLIDSLGFRHVQVVFRNDTVDVLVKSKKGDERKTKPLFLFCQGSLPIPLVVTYNDNGQKGNYPVFVFNTDSLATDYHLVIIGKPGIPVVAEQVRLNPDLGYADPAGLAPEKYTTQNFPGFYEARNINVLDHLRKQPWVSKKELVIAGHSEGSVIAARIAASYRPVTALIFSGGNPLGRISTILARARMNETDSNRITENIFEYWQQVIESPASTGNNGGDTNKSLFSFSHPAPIEYLKKMSIPVLITYGSRDYGSVQGMDYLRLEAIRLRKTNFTFRDYFGLDHNFFPVKPDGSSDYNVFNWDRVAGDWRKWLQTSAR